MTKEMKHVVWEWLPGVIAGFFPLLIFLFVSAQATVPQGDIAATTKWWENFHDGLVEHLIVLGIVTSAVSTLNSFPRLFSLNREDTPLGEGSLILVMLTVLILVFSVVMYALQQAKAADTHSLWTGNFWLAAGLAVVPAVTTYYVEVTIANLRMKRDAAKAT